VAVSHGGVSRVVRGHVLSLDGTAIPLLEVPQDKVLVLRAGTQEWI
jgi:probable phosphoglycerate mutase